MVLQRQAKEAAQVLTVPQCLIGVVEEPDHLVLSCSGGELDLERAAVALVRRRRQEIHLDRREVRQFALVPMPVEPEIAHDRDDAAGAIDLDDRARDEQRPSRQQECRGHDEEQDRPRNHLDAGCARDELEQPENQVVAEPRTHKEKRHAEQPCRSAAAEDNADRPRTIGHHRRHWLISSRRASS
jgi:hypothetical protein